MTNQEFILNLSEARRIAKELNDLLHEDALHRLRLYQQYSDDNDANKWNPNLYYRCKLVEDLCSRLNKFNGFKVKS